MNVEIRNEKNISNVVFSLNRECNLRCKHCCLNNAYKKNAEVISEAMLEEYFLLVDDWIEKQKNTLSFITILMSGAEVGMLTDEEFSFYGDKIFNFFHKMVLKYQNESLSFGMIILSNLTKFSDNKKQWVLNKDIEAKKHNISFTMATSYEKYTNRFSKPIHYTTWLNNLNWFIERDIPTTIIWTISKEDALDYQNILENFESIGSNIFYIPLIPTGETQKNTDLFVEYEDFSQFLINLYSYPFKKPLLVNQPYIYHYDRVSNLILEQNGFIMIDLLQDQVFNYEKTSNFKLNTEYLQNNTNIYKLTNDIEKNKLLLNNLWSQYLTQEKRKLKEQGCLTCDYYLGCKGGIGTFKPLYHSKSKCAGFKSALDTFFNHS